MSTHEIILLAQQTIGLLIDATALYVTFEFICEEGRRRRVTNAKEASLMIWAMISIPLNLLIMDMFARLAVSCIGINLIESPRAFVAAGICMFGVSFAGGIINWNRGSKPWPDANHPDSI